MKDQILKLIFLVFMVILGCSEENEQITGLAFFPKFLIPGFNTNNEGPA